MVLAQSIILGCWVIFGAYWLISARSVKATQEKAGGIGGIRHLLFVLVLIFLFATGLGILPIYPLNVLLIPHANFLVLLSVVMVLAGLIIAILARRTLAQNWSGAVLAFKKDHELIITGLYAYMRHPIYSGVLLMFLGTTLLAGSPGALFGFLVILSVFCLRMQWEEQLLTRHFPQQYPEYKKRVKALIPFLL
jgi:protein-S-isoprenylcysteine O-methyltransferase Ste14